MNLVTEIRPAPRRDPLLRLPAVEALVGLKKSTIYALMKRGEFPQCVQVTPRTVAWLESRVTQWVQDRVAAADDHQAGATTDQADASQGQPS